MLVRLMYEFLKCGCIRHGIRSDMHKKLSLRWTFLFSHEIYVFVNKFLKVLASRSLNFLQNIAVFNYSSIDELLAEAKRWQSINNFNDTYIQTMHWIISLSFCASFTRDLYKKTVCFQPTITFTTASLNTQQKTEQHMKFCCTTVSSSLHLSFETRNHSTSNRFIFRNTESDKERSRKALLHVRFSRIFQHSRKCSMIIF